MRTAFIAALLISSCLASASLIQTLKTQNNAPAHLQGPRYSVQVQWGGSSAPWNNDGQWVIGGRPSQRVVRLSVASSDEGRTLNGWLVYAGEGPIGFRGTRTTGSSYTVQVQWGGFNAGWNNEATWVLGGRASQPVTIVDLTASGNGFLGTLTYRGEGPISVNARLA